MTTFAASGNTAKAEASVTATTVAIVTNGTTGFMLTNDASAVGVWANVFATSTATFGIPTVATPNSGIYLGPNETKVLVNSAFASPTTATVYLKAVTASGTANVWATPGTAL